MKQVELLAPAGNYETMIGAFNAGADAVYLGGQMFGARAFADNFSEEEIISAINYAHLHGKKIYLTVNTLVKEREFDELDGYLRPFADAGLDGVIVQDLGVFKYIRDNFKNIELHASTQMTITGIYGARLLKSMGATRVVPARELSVQELREIRNEGIEVEAFIHGAMCYCYSGACLFSSMIGPRSGNRGRCAQPCRLPYSYMNNKNTGEEYPLSLKDMCVIDILPELLEAGIDSFKIEGRMKKPEYSAGVVSIYRKYIDLFMKKGPDGYVVSDKDRNKLKSLYLRTDISEGYMNKHNGKEMITLVKPGYNGVDENLVKNISEKYLNGPSKISISLDVVAREGELLKLTGRCNNIALQVFGDEVSEARKVAMTYDDFYKSLSKFGDTYFELKELKADIGDNVFVPVKQLNELRRTLASQMSERIIENNGFENKDISYEDYPESIFVQKEIKTIRDNGYNGKIHVHVKTWDQLIALTTLHNKPSRIYLDIILYLEALLNNRTDFIENFPNTQFYVALPYIAREEYGKIEINMINDLEYVRQTAVTNGFTGVLVRNMEELGYFLDKGFNGDIVLDYGVYVWNHESLDMLAHLNFKNLNVSLSGFCYPYELTRYECRELFNKSVESGFNGETSACIYGKVPMMITAGCVKRNLDVCTGKRSMLYSELVSINDRKKANFSVSAECRYCYNIIWNSVPNSQHKGLNKLISDNDCDYYRIDFTTESAFEVLKVYNYFLECFNKKNESSPEYEYTTGHFKQAAD